MLFAAREIPHQPRVNRAEREVASLGLCASAFDVSQNPLELRSREISVHHQSGLLSDQTGQAILLDPVANRSGAAVLPDDGIADGLSGGAIPDDRCLALI